MPLNENQLRAVGTAFQQCARNLDGVRELLLAGGSANPLASMPLRLPPERRAALASQIAALQSDLAALAQELELPLPEQDGVQWVRSHLAAVWVTLDELTGRKLRGYGAVDPILTSTFFPRVRDLVAQLEAIQAQL